MYALSFPRRTTRLVLEPLEDRLTPSWAGVAPATITPPTSAVSVVLDGQLTATGTASIDANEVDYYSFVAPKSGNYTVSALTPTSSLDTVLGVFSKTGKRLAYNDDIVTYYNTDSKLVIKLTAGTQYFVGVTNYKGEPGGAYAWKVKGPAVTADDAYENNDTLALANNLGALTASHTISNLVMADAHDWYKFTMNGGGEAGDAVSLAFQHAQGDLELALVSAGGAVLGASTSATDSESVSLDGLAAGTYFVHVYGYLGAANPNYHLTIDPGVAAPPPSSPPPSGSFDIQLRLTGMNSAQQAIFQQAADRWEQIIVGDLPNMTYGSIAVDDVLIDGSASAIDGAGGILGQAGPDRFRSGTFLPYHGSMEFDSADMAQMQSQGTLLAVIMHEMGHVLGIGTIWEDRGLLAGAGTSNPRFTGSQAVAAYNQIFGTSVTGVPVENSGGSGTRDSHWRESTFDRELMTGWIDSGASNPLSRVTAASLADLGYQVNLAAADSYTPPGGSSSSSGGSSSGSGASLRAEGPSNSWFPFDSELADGAGRGKSKSRRS